MKRELKRRSEDTHANKHEVVDEPLQLELEGILGRVLQVAKRQRQKLAEKRNFQKLEVLPSVVAGVLGLRGHAGVSRLRSHPRRLETYPSALPHAHLLAQQHEVILVSHKREHDEVGVLQDK